MLLRSKVNAVTACRCHESCVSFLRFTSWMWMGAILPTQLDREKPKRSRQKGGKVARGLGRFRHPQMAKLNILGACLSAARKGYATKSTRSQPGTKKKRELLQNKAGWYFHKGHWSLLTGTFIRGCWEPNLRWQNSNQTFDKTFTVAWKPEIFRRDL